MSPTLPVISRPELPHFFMPDTVTPIDADAQDIAWMERVKRGDMDAFAELVAAHQSRVVGTIAKMLGDDVDTEDIAQQVFLRVWNSAERYQPAGKFTTWLFTILRNLVFNELRRRKRHPTTSLDIEHDDATPIREAVDHGTKSPSVALQDAEMLEAVARAIDSLPEAQRMAIVLRRYQDVSYEEIAEILEVGVPAVKSLLFRARVQLREKLRQYLGE